MSLFHPVTMVIFLDVTELSDSKFHQLMKTLNKEVAELYGIQMKYNVCDIEQQVLIDHTHQLIDDTAMADVVSAVLDEDISKLPTDVMKARNAYNNRKRGS